MLRYSVRSNLAEKVERLDELGRSQLPYATALALTRTIKDVQAAEIVEMRSKFDRPTQYTLQGTFIRPATKSRLQAEVWLKDEASGGGTPAAKYLEPEVEGGSRRHKHFELALIRAGLMPSDLFAVPGAKCPLDAYGNIPGPFIEQLLSAIGAADTISGHTSNRTARSRARAPSRAEYFVGRPGRGTAPLGIWQRQGNHALPVIMFVRAPSYKPREDFFGVAERTTEAVFGQNFDAAMAQAIATARL